MLVKHFYSLSVLRKCFVPLRSVYNKQKLTLSSLHWFGVTNVFMAFLRGRTRNFLSLSPCFPFDFYDQLVKADLLREFHAKSLIDTQYKDRLSPNVVEYFCDGSDL